ncbi:MAG: rRNA maturation RNase YbeY [Cyclobacteriaceae bacterium]|jgi:rRNA maturation RNase YbeY|nr:rRNA maturation RNase YbeY [Cyclobacteriaceae bacterium]
MPSAAIRYFSEDTDFTIPHPRKTARWLKSVARDEKVELGEINFIFCSDGYLIDLNRRYLQHDYYTDILTFDNRIGVEPITGDIYISVDRVKDNANQFGVGFIDELHRVMVHGILHLIGYSDTTPSKKKVMKKKEDAYLSLRPEGLRSASFRIRPRK